MTFELIAAVLIVPALVTVFVFLLKHVIFKNVFYTAGSDILIFLILLDFGLAINYQQFKNVIRLSENVYTKFFMEFINWNVVSVFIILAVLGFIFLLLALKVEKSFKDHFTSGTQKPFLSLIGSIVCIFFCSITNLFVILLPLF
jgi:hypothetical protein